MRGSIGKKKTASNNSGASPGEGQGATPRLSWTAVRIPAVADDAQPHQRSCQMKQGETGPSRLEIYCDVRHRWWMDPHVGPKVARGSGRPRLVLSAVKQANPPWIRGSFNLLLCRPNGRRCAAVLKSSPNRPDGPFHLRCFIDRPDRPPRALRVFRL